MTHYDISYPEQNLDGLRRKRIIAWAIDAVLIFLLVMLISVALLVLGFVTFGLTWLLFSLLFGGITTITAILYTGLSIGSEMQGTPGMRTMGLRFTLDNGHKPGFVYGAAHLVLFYISISVLTPFILLVGLINSRKRLLHDIVIGVEIGPRG
jgi:uncharacterized RDD family membrane protein YckC